MFRTQQLRPEVTTIADVLAAVERCPDLPDAIKAGIMAMGGGGWRMTKVPQLIEKDRMSVQQNGKLGLGVSGRPAAL